MSLNQNNMNDDNVIDVGSKINNMKNKGKNFIGLAVIVILAVLIISQSLYILQSGKSAVVMRFGEVQRVEGLDGAAGLKFKIPFIDNVQLVDIESTYKMEYGYRTVKEGTEYSEPQTEDKAAESTVIVDAANDNASLVLIDLYAQYKVNDPVNYLFKVDDLEGTMRIALEKIIRATYQNHTLDDTRHNKELIDSEIKPALQAKMDEYDSGIEIVEVKTENAQLLPNVQAAYQQKENANQYKKGKLEEAEKYENMVLPKANADAYKLEEEALGYKAEVIADAKAGVAQFNALYEEYKKNPEIVKERYFVETMESFVKNNNIVIDATQDGGMKVFLNMDDQSNQKIYMREQMTGNEGGDAK